MIGMIAAIRKNNELGKDNKLLWRVPEDMKFFSLVSHTSQFRCISIYLFVLVY